jgi:hypothetical protein
MQFVLVEPTIVQDIYVSGIAEPEDLGDGNFRFTLYTRQKSHFDLGGSIDLVIVGRIILPAPAIMESMRMTMKAMGVVCCGAQPSRLTH